MFAYSFFLSFEVVVLIAGTFWGSLGGGNEQEEQTLWSLCKALGVKETLQRVCDGFGWASLGQTGSSILCAGCWMLHSPAQWALPSKLMFCLWDTSSKRHPGSLQAPRAALGSAKNLCWIFLMGCGAHRDLWLKGLCCKCSSPGGDVLPKTLFGFQLEQTSDSKAKCAGFCLKETFQADH